MEHYGTNASAIFLQLKLTTLHCRFKCRSVYKRKHTLLSALSPATTPQLPCCYSSAAESAILRVHKNTDISINLFYYLNYTRGPYDIQNK